MKHLKVLVKWNWWWTFTCLRTISLSFENHFLEFPWEVVFAIMSSSYFYLEFFEKAKRTAVCLKLILVRGFCPLIVEIARFAIGFRLSCFGCAVFFSIRCVGCLPISSFLYASEMRFSSRTPSLKRWNRWGSVRATLLPCLFINPSRPCVPNANLDPRLSCFSALDPYPQPFFTTPSRRKRESGIQGDRKQSPALVEFWSAFRISLNFSRLLLSLSHSERETKSLSPSRELKHAPSWDADGNRKWANSLLTCPHTTTFPLLRIFSPLEMSSIKIWEIIRS